MFNMYCIVGDLAFGQVEKGPDGILKLHRCVVVSFKAPVTTNTCMTSYLRGTTCMVTR